MALLTSPDGWLVLAILAAAIVAFASNRVPVDAVALAVLLVLAISGVVSVREAMAGSRVSAKAPKCVPRVKRIAGGLGVPSRSDLGEGYVGIEVLD